MSPRKDPPLRSKLTSGPLLDDAGTERFEIVRRIGEGGMGVVYHARERRSGRDVALKTLRSVDPQGIYRLKQEFRALSDLDHDNLIRLGELINEEGQWFFTMELLDGVTFLDHVAVDDGPLPFDPDKLRAALAQLAAGVSALHDAGRVHRDIKPTNVRVTSQGRVVLLDFGLATELEDEDPGARGEVTDENVVGTVAYMAPEQATGMPPGPEADWYSVGVVLFEALTGQLPFSGAAIEVMMDKQRLDPKRPSDLVSEVPADLDQLCVDLLSFDPKKRPRGLDIIERLGLAEPTPHAITGSTMGRRPFVGRNSELTVLREAFAASAHGAVATFISGESGIGKTLLVRRFVETVHDQAAVFRGRCYQRESLPFKAFDAMVDAISRYLNRLDQVDVALLLPKEIALLAKLFPVLKRVPAVARARMPKEQLGSANELRTRAFAAFNDLITAINDREPVVLFIDDLQWADADSLALLTDLMGGPDVPAILLLCSVRTEDDLTHVAAAPTVPTPSMVPPAAGTLPPPPKIADLQLSTLDADVRVLRLRRLGPDDAAALVTQLSGERDEVARSVAEDADGHPLFIHELVRHRSSTRHDAPLRLDEAIWARVRELDPPAQRMLVAVAVAGSPIDVKVAARAATLEGDARRWLGVLQVAHLVRTFGPRDATMVEPYHDRVREAVLAQLPDAERRDCHLRIAGAIELLPSDERDPRMLVRHLRAGGERQRAAKQAVAAAELAAGTLAFNQAAAFCRTALQLTNRPPAEEYELRSLLALSLRHAGRGRESAEAFIQAAEVGDPSQRVECRRNAAQELLIHGHIDEGMARLEDLLNDAGQRMPRSRRAAMLSFVWNRIKLFFRGRYRYRLRHEHDRQLLRRVDLYRAMARALAFVDAVRAADFHTRSLLMALKSGDRERIAWSFCYEFALMTMVGRQARARAMLDRARALSSNVDDPYLTALLQGMVGLSAYFAGRFVEASRNLAQIETAWAHQSSLAVPRLELHNGRVFRLFSLRHMGAFRDFKRLFDTYWRDAITRGDHYMETVLARGLGVRWLFSDEPERGRAALARAPWSPPEGTFHVQHWYDMMGSAEVALYEGDADGVRLEQAGMHRRLHRSQLLRVEPLRTMYWWLWGRLALAEAARLGDASALRDARRYARQLMRCDHEGYAAWGQVLEACAARRERDDEKAMLMLKRATSGFERSGMLLYQFVAERRLGQLTGGDGGEAMIRSADAWFASEEIVNPDRVVAMYTPGFDAS